MFSYYDISHIFRRLLRRKLYLVLLLFMLSYAFLDRPPHSNAENWNDFLRTEPELSVHSAKDVAGWDSVVWYVRNLYTVRWSPEPDHSTAIFERLSDKITTRITLTREWGRNATVQWSQHNKHALVVAHDDYEGRLGNFMFETASLLGIAATNNRIPVMWRKDEREVFFESLKLPVIDLSNISTGDVYEDGTSIYTARTATLTADHDIKPAILHGYYQSWKYFSNISDQVRHALTLDAKVQIKALAVIMRAVNEVLDNHNSTEFSTSRVTLVGVHVRRSDYLHKKWLEKGSTPVPRSYFLNAVRRYRRNHTPPIFIVLGDDIQYCEETFRGNDFYVVTEGLARVHLAILTLMDSLIISTGSFGWWGAYLSEATEVTYFKVMNTALGRAVRHEDYYPPGWQGAL